MAYSVRHLGQLQIMGRACTLGCNVDPRSDQAADLSNLGPIIRERREALAPNGRRSRCASSVAGSRTVSNRWRFVISNRTTVLLTSHRKGQIVEVAIRKMGNSQGVLIPKPILAQMGLEGSADRQVRDGVIEIRAVRRNPREGWADDARRLAGQGSDALVWPVVTNEGDDHLVW